MTPRVSEQAMRALLVKAGWKQKPTSMSWSWIDPTAPVSLWRLKDAYQLQVARERAKVTK